MKKNLHFALVFLLLVYFQNCFAQPDNRFGKLTQADFSLPKSSIIDSNTNAVIIADVGITDFVGNKNAWVNYVFKRKTRIKILNKKGLDIASVRINLYSIDKYEEEKLDDLSATTYNLLNGNIVESRLSKNDIYTDRLDKNHVVKRFTMPTVIENSIIEFSYTINSGFDFSLPDWGFQHAGYPCLWSSYEITIPDILVYAFAKQINHPFFQETVERGTKIYLMTRPRDKSTFASADQPFSMQVNYAKYNWIMKDIPGINNEKYLSTPENYIDKLEFQLFQTYNGEEKKDVVNTWEKVTSQLLDSKDFGIPLFESNSWLNDILDPITNGSQDHLSQGINIFYYVKDNFTCTSYFNKYISTSLKDIFKKKAGSVGEINLLLIAMLLQKGITAEPVLLSTREFGFNYPDYPLMSRLNYVICKAEINKRSYYLDASQPQLGFGYLSANCYNGHARIISRINGASIYFIPDSLNEEKTIKVILLNDSTKSSNFVGEFHNKYGYQESFELRKKIANTDTHDFFKTLNVSFSPDIRITNIGIDSLYKLENPVILNYNFTLMQGGDNGFIYFNPFIEWGYKKNPFTATERKYPVELPYTIDETYILDMQIPADFEINEVPKTEKTSFDDENVFFEYIIHSDEKMIHLQSHVKLNKTFFPPEKYSQLRDFFTIILKKQTEQIVFKKKNKI